MRTFVVFRYRDEEQPKTKGMQRLKTGAIETDQINSTMLYPTKLMAKNRASAIKAYHAMPYKLAKVKK